MPIVPEVKLETWKRLYELAAEIKKLAPWEFMEETEVIAFQHPETQKYGFISVMGMAGEHTALTMYHGEEAYFKFRSFLYRGIPNPLELLFTRQTQISFEDREMIQPEDRVPMKELGLKFRGRGNWPLFRSYRYGMPPWFIDQDEADFFLVGLEQALDVAGRIVEEDSDLLISYDEAPDSLAENQDYLFCRVPVREDGGIRWEDQFVMFTEPEPKPFKPIIDIGMVSELKSLPKTRMTFQVAVNIMPSPMEGSLGRPVFPALFMMADKQSGFVLATEILEPRDPITDTWQEIAPNFMVGLKRLGEIPKTVECSTPLMEQALGPIAGTLGFKIKKVTHLAMIDEALDSFASFMGVNDMPGLPEVPEDINLDNLDDVFNLLDSMGFSLDDLGLDEPQPPKRGKRGKR